MNQQLQAQLVVPPETPEYNPVYERMYPLAGMLETITIEFPPGCLGAIKARILEGGRQIAPMTGWYTGDGEAKNIAIGRRLEGPPYIITVQGYSTAQDYPHTISVLAVLHN